MRNLNAEIKIEISDLIFRSEDLSHFILRNLVGKATTNLNVPINIKVRPKAREI
jgi:hypothetical protein